MKFLTFKGLKNLNPKEQELILKYLVEFRKQNALNEVEVPEPEPIYRTMSVLKLTEGVRMTEADISLSADTDCNEQRAAATGQKLRGCFISCYEKLLTSVVSDSFTLSSEHTKILCRDKSDYLHDALPSCFYLLLDSKILLTPFNSVQIPQLFSNLSRSFP